MSSLVAAGLWVTFSVGLLVGLWAEEVERRSQGRVGVSRWVPAALGVLRAVQFAGQKKWVNYDA